MKMQLSPLLKFSLLECGYILWGQLEPLPALPLFREPLMPIPLYSFGIVRFYDMNCIWLLRKLYCKLVQPSADGVRTPDLVVFTSSNEVYKPIDV